jgi:hypothetical protein
LAPQGAFDVFDAAGRVVSNEKASQLADENVYVGVQKVAGGSNFERVGLTDEEFGNLKVMYPSMQVVKQLRLANGQIGGFIFNLRGVYSHSNTKEQMFRLIIDLREFPLQKPNAFVLSPKDDEIEHCNIYHENTFSVLPNIPLCAVCDGHEAKAAFISWSKNRMFRIRAWLNHLQSVLSNPNSDDRARHI